MRALSSDRVTSFARHDDDGVAEGDDDVRDFLARLVGRGREALALETDMKRSYVSDLERGTRNPSVKAIGRLAIALGVPASELLEVAGGETWPQEEI